MLFHLFPRDQSIHALQEYLPAGLALLALVFQVRKCWLVHRILHPKHLFVTYGMVLCHNPPDLFRESLEAERVGKEFDERSVLSKADMVDGDRPRAFTHGVGRTIYLLCIRDLRPDEVLTSRSPAVSMGPSGKRGYPVRYLLAVIAVILLTACGESQEVEDNTDTASSTEQVEQEQERRSAPEEPTSVPTSAPVQESTAEPTLEPTAAPEPTPASMTVEEYAKFCGELRGADPQTWGDVEAILGEMLAAYREATPPPVLDAYHESRVTVFYAMYGFAQKQGSSGEYDELAFFSDSSVFLIAMSMAGELESLPQDVRNELIAAGCEDEDESAQESTVAPAPSTTGVDLETTMEAPLLVSLTPGEFGVLQVEADPAFDLGEFELTLLVDGTEYCNSNRMYGDEGYYEMGCESEERGHESVERVSAQTSKGDLRCRKNAQSTNEQTIFACDWRTAQESTVAPAPSTTGVDLETTMEAPLLVSLTPGEFGVLQVEADPAFDLGEFELTLLVDGTEYCNSNRMYGDEGYYEMGCESEERGHESVERVSAQTSKGDLRCRKNAQSTNEQTIFACDWRTAQESTVAPAPSTTGVDLETTMEAPLLVSLTPGEFGVLQVEADPAFDLGEFELTLLVDGTEYCNSNRMYGDEGYYEMGCESEERGHESVERVSAQTSKGDLRCRKNAQSTNEQTIFACDWR